MAALMGKQENGFWDFARIIKECPRMLGSSSSWLRPLSTAVRTGVLTYLLSVFFRNQQVPTDHQPVVSQIDAYRAAAVDVRPKGSF